MTKEMINKNDLAFFISKNTLQDEAMKYLNRKLNYEEMKQAEDFLEWGIMESINIIYDTIFRNIESNKE